MKKLGRIVLVLGLASSAGYTNANAAEKDTAAFYENLQMKMVIRSSPGGSYDTFARLLARHIGRHIPGNPTLVSINMPGAGGIKATNYVINVAPRDGSIITNIAFGFPMQQALGLLSKVNADMRDFNWIGSFNATNQVLAVSSLSPTKTLEDARKRETLVGTSSPVSTGAYLPRAFNILLGTQFKVVTGYQSMSEVKLAIERNEVQGLGANGWSDLKTDFADFVDNNRLNVIIQVGMEKETDLPNVPLLIDEARNVEDRAVLEFITKGNSSLGKPFATSPGVPSERVAVLRRAFDATMKDKDFLADAEQTRAKIAPVRGETLQQLVADIVTAPAAVVEKANAALGLAGAGE